MENKSEKVEQNSLIDNFAKTENILKDMCEIIEIMLPQSHRL